MNTTFNEWLERQLIRNGLFACDLAKKLHMSPATISKYRHGKCEPHYVTVVAMCSILGDDPARVWKMMER